MAESKTYEVYIVECADGTLYTGISVDAVKRVELHNLGKGAKYTKARLPVRLLHREPAASKSEALQREYRIKRLSRQQKLALIRDSWKDGGTCGRQ